MTMKTKAICLLLYLFLFASALSYAQSWKWERKAGSPTNDVGQGTTTDKYANVYTTGYFTGTMSIGTASLISRGGWDVYLAKYDSSGNFIWAKSAGSVGDDNGATMCTDDSLNVYLVGTVNGTAIFGTDTLIGFGGDDCFLAKYNSAGTLIWVRHMGGAGADEGTDVLLDKNGDLVLSGCFSNTCSFDTITAISQGGSDAFIAKYSSSGHVKWISTQGGTSDDLGFGIAIDNNNKILYAGLFTTSATFGTVTLTGLGANYNTFVSRYSSTGNLEWIKQAGGNGPTNTLAIATDLNGSVYITGYFSGTTHFDTTSFICKGQVDAFVSKYDNNGNRRWTKRFGGPNYDYSFAIATDKQANCYIAGDTGATAHIHIFINKYDSAGAFEWTKTAGGYGQLNAAYGLATDAAGYLYVNGIFSSYCPFDSDTLHTNGGWDIFLSKLSSPPDMDDAGINELNFAQNVVVYPNPTTGMLTVKNENGLLKRIYFYNLLGEQVYSNSSVFHRTIVEFDLSKQAAGIYFIKIETDKGVMTKKIILN